MSDHSEIEWTDASWNPVAGCSKVSPGCAHCYAEALSLRFKRSALPWLPENAAENVVLHPERLDLPLRWKAPRRVFVNSMSDLFHELVPDAFVDQVFAVMAAAHRHTFQVLTKRPERMRAYVARLDALSDYDRQLLFEEQEAVLDRASCDPTWPLPNVWLGTSIENDRWTGRAAELRATTAAVRFISAEPLLGPLPSLDLAGIDWLIAGGESGPGHRPMQLDWVRDLRDRCQTAGVAFFYKQPGGAKPGGDAILDGREWREFPAVAA